MGPDPSIEPTSTGVAHVSRLVSLEAVLSFCVCRFSSAAVILLLFADGVPSKMRPHQMRPGRRRGTPKHRGQLRNPLERSWGCL